MIGQVKYYLGGATTVDYANSVYNYERGTIVGSGNATDLNICTCDVIVGISIEYNDGVVYNSSLVVFPALYLNAEVRITSDSGTSGDSYILIFD